MEEQRHLNLNRVKDFHIQMSTVHDQVKILGYCVNVGDPLPKFSSDFFVNETMQTGKPIVRIDEQAQWIEKELRLVKK